LDAERNAAMQNRKTLGMLNIADDQIGESSTTRRHPERSRFSGGAKDLVNHNGTGSEIPRPAGEKRGL